MKDKETYVITSLPVAFHPGETLEEKLQEMEMSIEDFAAKANIPENVVRAIIDQRMSITADIALDLEKATEIPAYLWLRFQVRYDEYVLKNKQSSYIEHLHQFTRKIAASVL